MPGLTGPCPVLRQTSGALRHTDGSGFPAIFLAARRSFFGALVWNKFLNLGPRHELGDGATGRGVILSSNFMCREITPLLTTHWRRSLIDRYDAVRA